MSKLVIFGAGQTAEIVYHYFTTDSPHQIVAFTADKAFIKRKTFLGLPVVPFETVDKEFPPSEFDMFVAMSYTNLNRLRAAKYAQAKKKKYRLITYISSKSSLVGKRDMGDNCLILESQVIQPYATIGNDVFVWGGVVIGHHSRIDDHCWLTSESSIGGNTHIGPYCFLGLNATVGHVVTVGAESFIGANTLVTKNAPPKSVFIAKGTDMYPLDSDKFLSITKMK